MPLQSNTGRLAPCRYKVSGIGLAPCGWFPTRERVPSIENGLCAAGWQTQPDYGIIYSPRPKTALSVGWAFEPVKAKTDKNVHPTKAQ